MALQKVGSFPVANWCFRLAMFMPIRSNFEILELRTRYNSVTFEIEGIQFNLTDLKMIGLLTKVYEEQKRLAPNNKDFVKIELTKEDICAFNGWNTSDYSKTRKNIVDRSLKRLKQIEIRIKEKHSTSICSIYNRRTYNKNGSVTLELNKLAISGYIKDSNQKIIGTFFDLIYKRFYSKSLNKEYYDFSYLCFDTLNKIDAQVPALLFAFLNTHDMSKPFTYEKIKQITNSSLNRNCDNKKKIVKALDSLQELNIIADYKINDIDLIKWLYVSMPVKKNILEGEALEVKTSNLLSDKSYERKMRKIENDLSISQGEKLKTKLTIKDDKKKKTVLNSTQRKKFGSATKINLSDI
jgi:hypothetical protein